MRPIIHPIPTFDATVDRTFTYVYDGNQQFSVEFIIRDIIGNTIVFQQKQTTFQLRFTLSANSLNNGSSYTAECIVYDRDGVASDVSDRVFFRCFSTPLFNITSPTMSQTINNSSHNIKLSYTQLEGDLLNTFYVILYDINHNIIRRSDVISSASGLIYTMTGLLDNQSYYVSAFGTTVSGILVQTPEVQFSVEYTTPSLYSLVFLENLACQGVIKIKSNLLLIDGKSDPDPPIFIDDKKVDLREESSWVLYDEGFSIEGDFFIQIDCSNIPSNVPFLKMSGGGTNNVIILELRYGSFDNLSGVQNYISLNAYNNRNDLSYRQTSNLIPKLEPTEEITITLKRIGGLYSVTMGRR